MNSVINPAISPAKRNRRRLQPIVVPLDRANAPRVLLQQNSIPHYRKLIFEILSQHPGAQVTIVADTKSDTPFLKSVVDFSSDIRHKMAHTHILRIPRVPDFYWQPGAIGLAWRERPDLIIALGSPYSLTAWVLCVLGRIRKTPVLLWTHGLLEAESGPRWWIRRALYRLAAGLLLYGDHAKRLLTDAGFAPDTLHVVYNSLDIDAQQRATAAIGKSEILAFRRSLNLKRGDGLVVFTGRLQPEKRLDLLQRAISLLAAQGRRVHAVVIGDGGERAGLVTLAAELGISDQVHFLGAIYDEAKLGLALKASDLAIVPSAAGLSIIHAMAYGTPMLIHDRIEHHGPEWEAVKDGRTGFFYQFDNVDDLARKIESALASPTRRARMSRQCLAIIHARYNPYRQSDAIVQAVTKTLKKTHAARPTPIPSRRRKPVTNGG